MTPTTFGDDTVSNICIDIYVFGTICRSCGDYTKLKTLKYRECFGLVFLWYGKWLGKGPFNKEQSKKYWVLNVTEMWDIFHKVLDNCT